MATPGTKKRNIISSIIQVLALVVKYGAYLTVIIEVATFAANKFAALDNGDKNENDVQPQ